MLMLFLTGCHSGSRNSGPGTIRAGRKVPSGILTHDEMVKVLVDVHLAEAALFQQQGKGKDVKVYSKYYYDAIFREHKITRKQFDESLKYYQDHLKEFESVYQDVLTALSKKQSRPPR